MKVFVAVHKWESDLVQVLGVFDSQEKAEKAGLDWLNDISNKAVEEDWTDVLEMEVV